MKISKIKTRVFKSNGFRIDASFHLSDGVVVRRKIAASPYKIMKVGDAANQIFYGNRAKRVYVQKRENGIPFLSSSDILQADLENVKLASKKYTPCIEQMRLQEGWILISRSGTIGNTAWATKQHAQKLASEHVIRIDPNNILRAGFVYAYLSSSYGHSLLTQGTFGAVIQHIEPDFVASLPIPQFPAKFQEKVDNLIKESARLREEANRFLNEAVSEFEKCLNPECYKREFCTSTVSTKQILKKFNRLDSHYQIAQKEFVKRRKRGLRYEKIGPKAEKIFVGNRGKRLYSKEGVPFLSSSDMMLFNALRYSKNISVNTPSLKMMQVHKNEILISRSGTVGNSVLIGDLLNKKAVSEHALRLLLDEQKIKPSYVFAYLNTEEGRELLQSLAYGSVIVTLGEDFVADIDLPILDEQIQRKIIQKINEYVWASDSAAEKESLAISLVEKEIDGWKV
ncbi:restriction endonuclease subunit S [Fibrobacter sp. UWR2]|uniref:methylation-associated defense system restriction endonuclease subunit S MAD5 n=1 Tax=Fibrobacter sp. UWR2 TaxID=1964352 RepID=UPI000B51F1B7|nr:restriction endonuclease subunit S [Fibrobacter sp. UWR2]OWV01100.1 hypothetical protein B7994_04825 [Fibrobacter sp. UWR2]